MTPDPAKHAIEGFFLAFFTFGMVVYFTVSLLAMWIERPVVGRDDCDRPTVMRDKRHGR